MNRKLLYVILCYFSGVIQILSHQKDYILTHYLKTGDNHSERSASKSFPELLRWQSPSTPEQNKHKLCLPFPDKKNKKSSEALILLQNSRVLWEK